jgi:catechol 2,3-dioxygenase
VEQKKTYRLPGSTHIRSVHLRTAGLSSMRDFYCSILGLMEMHRDGNVIQLAPPTTKEPMLILTELKGARPRPSKTAGLFHTAFRFPERKDLASMLLHLNECKYPMEGFADHGVSEALYLSDPDGNGLELYADRPRSRWQFAGGEVQMPTKDLDIDGLLSELPENFRWRGIHPNAVIGHIHLNVSDLERAEEFYCDGLGFTVTQRGFPGALFLSAGGYHHHIGLNTWTGRGTVPAADDTIGLVRFGIDLGNNGAIDEFNSHARSAGIFCSAEDSSIICRDNDKIEIEIF